MGERKVINKYYPPDFDPEALPRRRQQKSKQMKVRMMLAMNICCKTCGNFMYAGTKFNTRLEKAQGEEYLGMPVHRFYMRCKRCSAEIAIKTDPKNTDYVVEAGATRNYEPSKEQDAAEEDRNEQRRQEEETDAMKALENKTLHSKMQQDILSNLEDLKTLQAQHARWSEEDVLKALRVRDQGDDEERKRKEREEEDEEVYKAFHATPSQSHQELPPSKASKPSHDEPERAPAKAGKGVGALRPKPKPSEPSQQKEAGTDAVAALGAYSNSDSD